MWGLPDPVNDEKAPLCQTLADRILDQTRKPSQIILFATPQGSTLITDAAPELAVLHQDKRFTTHIIDDIAPDFDKRLKELTARQTELFNADAPLLFVSSFHLSSVIGLLFLAGTVAHYAGADPEPAPSFFPGPVAGSCGAGCGRPRVSCSQVIPHERSLRYSNVRL